MKTHVRILAAVLALSLFTLPAWAQSRVRKHVEDLTAAELQALDHAIGKLKALPEDNPNNYYDWADIHGDASTPGWGCDHESELLLPWHRAYLVAFEDALRAIDPPVTKDVTLPYWDWTEKPTGVRYPKSFETYPNLLPACKTPCNKPRITTPNTRPPYSADEIARIQELPTFSRYGGGTQGSGRPGDIETGPHNYIHGTYINGLNRSTRFASRDPLFWLHHSNLDRLWAEWQTAHVGPQHNPICVDCPIRFLPNKFVKDYLDIRTLGYSYQARQSVTAEREAIVIAGIIGLELPRSAKVIETALSLPPTDTINTIHLVFEDLTTPVPAPYLARIYLRPKNAAPKTRSDSDLVAVFSIWRGGEAHAEHAAPIDIERDITQRALEVLGEKKASWVLQIDILKINEDGTPVQARLGEDIRWKKLSVVVDTNQTTEVK